MSNPFTFEIEEFELPESAEEKSCDCPKCRTKRRRDEFAQNESSDELNFADELEEEAHGGLADRELALGEPSNEELIDWLKQKLGLAAAPAKSGIGQAVQNRVI